MKTTLSNHEIEKITKMVAEIIAKNEAHANVPANAPANALANAPAAGFPVAAASGPLIPVGVSARHAHLTQEHIEILFGEGYQLTKKNALMGGQFATNEMVTIVGLKLRAIENVRILGPARSASQVEISATDAVKLGIHAPVRESGNIKGSEALSIVGPKGAVYLKEGCIIAKIHIHMPPKDAMALGVSDGDLVAVKKHSGDNERALIFNDVQIRVAESFTLELHLDTDEANAAQIFTGDKVKLVGKKEVRC
ncbi:MAG: phosphate propanoyltransferase [Lachnospiraceae bacterium]|nr:phosphate propanoyltransferase [Lachnospiraceae bacterium]